MVTVLGHRVVTTAHDGSHVEYELLVQPTTPTPPQTTKRPPYSVWRRYRTLRAARDKLEAETGVWLAFPPRRVASVTTAMDDAALIAEREDGLREFFDAVNADEALFGSSSMRALLRLDDDPDEDMLESASNLSALRALDAAQSVIVHAVSVGEDAEWVRVPSQPVWFLARLGVVKTLRAAWRSLWSGKPVPELDASASAEAWYVSVGGANGNPGNATDGDDAAERVEDANDAQAKTLLKVKCTRVMRLGLEDAVRAAMMGGGLEPVGSRRTFERVLRTFEPSKRVPRVAGFNVDGEASSTDPRAAWEWVGPIMVKRVVFPGGAPWEPRRREAVTATRTCAHSLTGATLVVETSFESFLATEKPVSGSPDLAEPASGFVMGAALIPVRMRGDDGEPERAGTFVTTVRRDQHGDVGAWLRRELPVRRADARVADALRVAAVWVACRAWRWGAAPLV